MHRRASPPASDTEYFSGSDADGPPTAPHALDDDDDDDDASPRVWHGLDLSVAVALLSPTLNWLTGSDHVKNILLVLLILFYLHQIVQVPWSLYLAARPRRRSHAPPHDADELHGAAQSELRRLELCYLALSVLSPFLGAALLRTAAVSISGPSTLSWFSLSLFVLATGVRPWRHAIQRLRQRSTDLHTIIHYPPPDSQKIQSLIDRVAQLEAELHSLRNQSKSLNSQIYDHVEDAVEMMEITARRQEKKSEVSKAFVDARLSKLEQNIDAILEQMEIRADRPPFYRIMAHVSTLVAPLIDRLSPFLPTWVLVRYRANVARSPRCTPKLARSRSATKLETIPEVAAFQPRSYFYSPRYLHIPGFRLACRICGLATYPLRRIIARLLPGQIYITRSHKSES